MRIRVWLALVGLTLCCACTPAASETVTEVWRGSFSYPVSVSVNPSDGSCWVADHGRTGAGDARVVHLSSTGEVLWQSTGFQAPEAVSVNASDGSCWVGDLADL